MYGGSSDYYGSVYGGGSDDASGSSPLNLIQYLTENFDSTLDSGKWFDYGGSNLVVADGLLQITSTTDPGGGYFGINTIANNWALQDSYIFAKVVDAGDQSSGFEVYPFQLTDGGLNVLLIYIVYGSVNAVKRLNDGTIEFAGSFAYNPTIHKWFRIRNSGSTIYYDWSTDGHSWTNFATSTATGFDLSNCTVDMLAGSAMGIPATTAKFDNLNLNSLDTGITGTFTLGGLVKANVSHEASISGVFKLGGSVSGQIEPILQTAATKLYEYKIYDPHTGDFLGRWNDVVSEFTYSQEINTGGSNIDVTLARNSDSVVRSFEALTTDDGTPITTDSDVEIAAEISTTNAIGPGTTVDLNLDVKVYVFPEDGSDVDGELIFTGYISKYTSNYGSKENTIVSVFSYGADMDNYVLEDDDSRTRVPYLSVDPSDIIKDALNRFNSDGGIPSFDHGGTTIDDTGTDVSYTFNVNTILEVINKGLELAPTDWYWYYDQAINNVHFHARPTEPTHTFVLGKHIIDLNLEKYIEDLTNVVYFTGGPQNPFISDPFTGTAGTAITSHTGTVGATWSLVTGSGAGSAVISDANRLRSNSATEASWYASGESFSSDMTISADVYIASWAGNTGLIGRVSQSAYTYYLAKLDPTGNKAQIYKNIAGSFTLLAEAAYSNPGTGTTHNMQFKIEGAELSLLIDGDTYVRATNTDIPTGSRAGLRMVSADSNTTGIHYANFQVSSQANQDVNIFKKYTDATSLSDYRRGLQRLNDSRVKLESSADILAQSAIDRGKEPRYQSSVKISDRVYDIESIKLGELVTFRNFGNFIDTLEMQIVRIDYTPAAVTLQLDTLLPSVPKRLEDVKRNLNQSDMVNNPDTPS